MKLVECVPNVSEGRDRRVIDAIGAAIAAVEGVRLLDVDPGAATNRTVFTFVGPPDAVGEAAFRVVEKAAALIDMRAHRGAHPRLGAADVCPFVPLGGTSMAECVDLARRVGRRVGEDLGIPVFLYEQAATAPSRRSLADVRRGEYEGLEARLREADHTPDYGPRAFNARSGATVIGAREFLIAYNVNLNTRDRRLAGLIAQNIRETGRPARDPDGRVAKDDRGRAITEPGPSMLRAVRATGWSIEEYGRAQVSMNLTDYKVTPPHAAFEAVEAEASALGLRVTGSEVVGLIPLEAVRMAGRHFLSRQGKSPAAPESELVRAASVSLGLDDVQPFDPSRKIIEYCVAAPRPLASLTVSGLADEVSAATPAPGGGSVAALAGALAAGLAAMVAGVSYERREMEPRREELGALGARAQALKARLLDAVDEDAAAFRGMLEAGRLPRTTEDDRRARADALLQATRRAIEVPLWVMKDAVEALELAGRAAVEGAAAASSDAGVAAACAAAAAEGAYYNVRINLSGLSDASLAATLRAEAEALRARARELAGAAGRSVVERIEAP